MAVGLQEFTDRVGDGNGQPRLDAGEELMHVQPDVAVVLGNRPPESPGTLYITTKRVVWLSDADKTKGYAVDFLSVSLHAVSRDPESYRLPCIYTQIDTNDDENESGGSDAEDNHAFDLQTVTEMRLIPSDPNQLDALFDVFCECAELNPDPNQGQDEDNEWFFGDEEMVGAGDSEEFTNPIGCSNGHNDISHTMLELQINDQRFEDAEEDEPENDGHQRRGL